MIQKSERFFHIYSQASLSGLSRTAWMSWNCCSQHLEKVMISSRYTKQITPFRSPELFPLASGNITCTFFRSNGINISCQRPKGQMNAVTSCTTRYISTCQQPGIQVQQRKYSSGSQVIQNFWDCGNRLRLSYCAVILFPEIQFRWVYNNWCRYQYRPTLSNCAILFH